MITEQNKKKFDPGKWLGILLVVLFVSSILGLIILDYFQALKKDSFGREIGIILLQIISVGVIGTILSLLLAKFNQKQEQFLKEQQAFRMLHENKTQFKKDILHQLDKIYSDVKSIRRILRAKAFTIPYNQAIATDDARVDLKYYDEALEDINSIQLQLEIIMKEIATNEKIVPSQTIFKDYEKIQKSISDMEKYLGILVKEYEENRAKADGAPLSLPIKDLSNIKKMLGHTDHNSPFKTKFIMPYKEVTSSIRSELLSNLE